MRIYWITGALPLVITGLLAIVLLGMCGVMTPRTAYSLFGSEAVFFVLAAFMLAAAVNYRGLGRRVAMMVFARYGKTPHGLIRAIYLLSALMSFLIPEHAVAAIVFPIVLNLANSLEPAARRTRYPTALFLAMAWGTNIGGIATLLGGARGPLALGILTESTGVTISFTRWSAGHYAAGRAPAGSGLLGAGYLFRHRSRWTSSAAWRRSPIAGRNWAG